MTSGTLLLGFLTLQRLSELVIATRNTKALLHDGAYERGAGHYPVMVALHATWLATLWLFGWSHAASAPFVAAFALLQIARLWIMLTLGRRWTTRIIVAPGVAPVTSGPFRFVRHPNYLVVALEIPCVSLALGLAWHAALFGALNLTMLWWRIRAEDRAFAAESARMPVLS
ncbi:MAG TPA: isoprenylcysteine carboxylmethyltransferase family protein [Candidatus Elarobacter sp.]